MDRYRYPIQLLLYYKSAVTLYNLVAIGALVLQIDDVKEVDCLAVIEKVYRHLRKNNQLTSVHAITNAKVPIIKFIHREKRLEGDISLYNTLVRALSCH